MNAFIQIIERLIESVSPQAWKELEHFPFQFLDEPKSSMFDACLFECSAQGAYGFLWIKFDRCSKLFMLPFELARHSEDAALVSLTPWSLKDASTDFRFYSSWRHAQKTSSVLMSCRGGVFHHIRKSEGEPGLVAVGVSSDLYSTAVRIDFQVLYRLYRVFDPEHPNVPEVELLTFLQTQNIFHYYPKIINIFEYAHPNLNKFHSVIGLKYIQNEGTLFSRIVSLIFKSRFSTEFIETSSIDAWEKALQISENLGQVVADFHRAVSLAPKTSKIGSVILKDEDKPAWFDALEKEILNSTKIVNSLSVHYERYKNIFLTLEAVVYKLLKKVKKISDTGLLIRVHGDLHLGRIVYDRESLYIVEYDSRFLKRPVETNFSHNFPAIKDVAYVLGSLRFAWHYAEKKYFDTFSDLSGFGYSKMNTPQNNKPWRRQKPTVLELESSFVKFYLNSMDENVNASELRPKTADHFENLLNYYILEKILLEISTETVHPNPRSEIWLSVLTNFINSEK